MLSVQEVVQERQFDYPLAFRSKKSGAVVIFYGRNKGLRVVCTNDVDVFYHSDVFTDHEESDTWEPVNIKLSHS